MIMGVVKEQAIFNNTVKCLQCGVTGTLSSSKVVPVLTTGCSSLDVSKFISHGHMSVMGNLRRNHTILIS